MSPLEIINTWVYHMLDSNFGAMAPLGDILGRKKKADSMCRSTFFAFPEISCLHRQKS